MGFHERVPGATLHKLETCPGIFASISTLVCRSLVIALLIFSLCDWATALPVFARRYETSCTTCHAIIPKLNPFGIAFRNNGYRIPPGDQQVVQGQDVSLGAPAWKTLWPKAVWPGAIQSVPPIAVRATMEAGIRPSEPVKLNFNFPSLLALYFAGPAGETFSFFGNVLLLGPANTLVLDRAYGQFRLVPEEAGANWLNLKIGRIDTRAEPFASTFRRTTAQGFNVGEYRTLSDGFSFRDRDSGVELWGAATGPDNRGGLEYGVGILQGTAGKSENNNFKDQYWSVLYKFGGFGTVGSRDDRETLTLNNNYSEWSFAAGTFGYRGKGQTSASDVTENQFERVGMKFDAYLDDLNLFGAIVSGRDHLEGIAPRRIDTSAFFVQADYMLLPWVMPILRFEKTKYSDGRKPVREVIAAANIALRANVRVLLEGHFYGANTGKNEGMIRFEFLF